MTKNINKFPVESANVFSKQRNSKSDEEMKMVVIKQYNQLADNLSKQYYEELDVNVVCDILLDIMRCKNSAILDA